MTFGHLLRSAQDEFGVTSDEYNRITTVPGRALPLERRVADFGKTIPVAFDEYIAVRARE
ncbi:hypothetical protein H4R18_002227 [Coemansia javaensis]|uniref:Uncharacterized protein n=1 Tax=Coemansia javaensis TaxID=2761396 RepID=A0A9W8LJG9_9FUNG|nr:hypothetical protein H4R18_002227 [Coemansia javaensis]